MAAKTIRGREELRVPPHVVNIGAMVTLNYQEAAAKMETGHGRVEMKMDELHLLEGDLSVLYFSFDHRMTSMSLALARSQIKSFVLFTRRPQDDNIFMRRSGDVSLPCLSVNWGQVISVTVVNALSADKVLLTFLERKAQI